MAGSHEIALSELIGALSRALDVAEGEPPGHAVRSCLIGMRIADALDLESDSRSDLFYALLLKDAGCSANAAHMAALFGADDQVAKRTSKLVNWARPLDAFVWSLRTVAPEGSLAERAGRLRAIRNEGQVTRSLMRARCHRGAEIVLKLGFSEATADAIRALDEHWDGLGQPLGLRGAEIPIAARMSPAQAQAHHDAVGWHQKILPLSMSGENGHRSALNDGQLGVAAPGIVRPLELSNLLESLSRDSACARVK